MCVVFILHAALPSYSQDSTYFQEKFGTGQKELDLVLRGIDVEHASYAFKDENIKGKQFHFRVKEFRDGELKVIADLLEGKPDYVKELYTMSPNQDRFLIQSFARATGEQEVEVKLIFNGNHSYEPRFITPMKSEASTLRYSLRSDYFEKTKDKGRSVPLKEFFPFLVYAPPFKMDDGWFGYICSNPRFKKIPLEQWGDISGLEHFVVIELKIDEAD